MSFRASVSLSPSATAKFAEFDRKTRVRAAVAINDGTQALVDQSLDIISRETALVSTAIVANTVEIDRATPARPHASIRVKEQPILLTAFRPVAVADGLLVNARIGRGPQRIRGGFIRRDGLAVIPEGQGLRPLWGPSTANLFADAAELAVDRVTEQIRERLR